MKPPPKNFANGSGYKAPVFARPLLSCLPSVHQKDQPPTVNILAGPYRCDEYRACLKTVEEYSRAGKALVIVYTRFLVFIAEDLSRELLAVDLPSFPSSPVQAPALPGPSHVFKLAPYLVPLLPHHATFVDLVGGDASLLMLKSRARLEIFNDRRSEVSNLFATMRARGPALAQLLALTPYNPGQFRKSASEEHHDPLERARRSVLRMAHGVSQESWRTYQNALPGIVARFQGVEVTDTPAEKLLAHHDRPTTHFHLDLSNGDKIPEALAGLKSATVSILADKEPPRLPFRLFRRALPDPVLSVWTGRADNLHRKRTATVQEPRQVPLRGLDLGTRPRPDKPGPEWVVSVRHDLGFDRAEFAAVLGVPERMVKAWEKPGAKLNPAAERLVALAESHPEIF